MAVLEALASSTAVLLSPGCHFPEVEKVGAGRIVSLEPEAIADSLGELLADAPRLRSMGERGRLFAHETYSWDRITATMVEVYAEGSSG